MLPADSYCELLLPHDVLAAMLKPTPQPSHPHNRSYEAPRSVQPRFTLRQVSISWERRILQGSLLALWLGGGVYALGYDEKVPNLRTLGAAVIAVSTISVLRCAVVLFYRAGSSAHDATTTAAEAHATAIAIDHSMSDDPATIQYKKILRSILPAEFLSPEGFLRTSTGTSEPIAIRHSGPSTAFSKVISLLIRDAPDPTVPPAHYNGPLCYRTLLHRLMQSGNVMGSWELQCLREFAEQQIQAANPRDIIDIRRGKHGGVLAHETFHDIQNFLYENHRDVIDKLRTASESCFHAIEAWYKSPANVHYAGPGAYTLEHFFPTADTESPYGPDFIDVMLSCLKHNNISNARVSNAALIAIGDAHQDLGRNELIPTLLSAASEGNAAAAAILAGIFEDAGLNKDFYDTLPRLGS